LYNRKLIIIGAGTIARSFIEIHFLIPRSLCICYIGRQVLHYLYHGTQQLDNSTKAVGELRMIFLLSFVEISTLPQGKISFLLWVYFLFFMIVTGIIGTLMYPFIAHKLLKKTQNPQDIFWYSSHSDVISL
jgi:hypothetical protein